MHQLDFAVYISYMVSTKEIHAPVLITSLTKHIQASHPAMYSTLIMYLLSLMQLIKRTNNWNDLKGMSKGMLQLYMYVVSFFWLIIGHKLALGRLWLTMPLKPGRFSSSPWSFKKGKDQLSQAEVETSWQLSWIRIHVERAIGRLKNYGLLSSTLPISLLKTATDVNYATIDKILITCAALSNPHPCLV
jgi:hypothetical protein